MNLEDSLPPLIHRDHSIMLTGLERRRYDNAVQGCKQLLRDMVGTFLQRSNRNQDMFISMVLPRDFNAAFDLVRLSTSHPTLTDVGTNNVGSGLQTVLRRSQASNLGAVAAGDSDEDGSGPSGKRRTMEHDSQSMSSKLRMLEEVQNIPLPLLYSF